MSVPELRSVIVFDGLARIANLVGRHAALAAYSPQRPDSPAVLLINDQHPLARSSDDRSRPLDEKRDQTINCLRNQSPFTLVTSIAVHVCNSHLPRMRPRCGMVTS